MSDPPNVVLVTVDSLRADHCGCHGYDKDTTPTLDRMAEEGVVFEEAIAPGPSTPESMPAIFTGHHPVDRGAGNGSDLEARRHRIRTHMAIHRTIPERFRGRGYSTAAFTPNPFTSRAFGFDRGFDHFQDFMSSSRRGGLYRRLFRAFLGGSRVAALARVFRNAARNEEVFKPWESYYGEVTDWLERAREPYFLWVFLMDAHNPYRAAAGYRTQSRWKQFHANVEFWRQSHETPFSERVHERLVTAYDDAVRYADAFLGRLRGDLPENTVIAVHGDHGEAFGEHGTYGHEPYLHRENLHVPLVVEGAGQGRVSDPFPLCRLPRLLSALASGEDPDVPSHALALTRQGGRIALYDGDDLYTFGTENGGVAPGAVLPGHVERQQITAAAASLSEEGGL